MKKVVLGIALGLSGVLASTAVMAAKLVPAGSPAVRLVQKVTQNQVVITKEFKAVSGFQGFVVKPKTGQGASMILYVDPKAQHVFIGNIINAAGKNLTQSYTEKYINSVLAKTVYANIGKTAWFTDGKNSAPHKAYVFIDPNCIYCHLLYKETIPLIDQGKLQVRWIPVGFLKPTSLGKAAALLHAGGDKAASALLRKDETAFKTRQEEGGIKPLVQDAHSMTVSAAFSKVQRNTAFFNQYAFQGTPVILYRTQDGQPTFFPGYAGGKQWKTMWQSMSAHWDK